MTDRGNQSDHQGFDQSSKGETLEVEPFGQSSSYYDAKDPKRTTGIRSANVLNAALERGIDEEIRRTVSNWNKQVRSSLRTETRLQMGDARVTVAVVDGIPEPMADIIDDYPDAAFWFLVLNRPLLKTTEKGLEVLLERKDELLGSSQFGELADSFGDTTEPARFYVSLLLDKIDEQEVVERIRSIRQDVLGAYFYRRGRIEIYWTVIAMYSRLFGVPAADLTVVVLMHELAHAYTHIGQDIDGRHWETSDFAGADLRIVEGLAQYYTRRLSERLSDRYPGILQAYRALLKNQSEPYRAQETWFERPQNLGEGIRQAILDCRIQGIGNYAVFESTLTGAQDRLSNTKPENP